MYFLNLFAASSIRIVVSTHHHHILILLKVLHIFWFLSLPLHSLLFKNLYLWLTVHQKYTDQIRIRFLSLKEQHQSTNRISKILMCIKTGNSPSAYVWCMRQCFSTASC